MKKSILVLIIVILSITPGSATDAALSDYGDRILQTSSGNTYGLGQILPDLKKTSVIFLGEQHDDIRHHHLQLMVLRTLHNLGISITVGLEMFTARDQNYLESWIQGTLPENQFIKTHERNWGNTWKLYSPIYRYARDKGIPLLGLNVPEEITTQAARQGFSSLSPEQRSQLPLVSCDIDESYLSFMKKALAVHESPEVSGNFENFCEAQLIWDATMAYRIATHIEQKPDRTLVVIAGNSHSWRPGIPGQLKRFSDGIDYRIILPEIRPVQTRHSIDETVADYLWLLE